MIFGTRQLSAAIASTLCLTLLASCDATLTRVVPAPGTTSGMSQPVGATTNTAGQANSIPTAATPLKPATALPATKGASAVAVKPTIHVADTLTVEATSDAARLEGEIEGYNALAESAEATDTALAAGYSLKAVGTARADSRPSRGQDAFGDWGMGDGEGLGKGVNAGQGGDRQDSHSDSHFDTRKPAAPAARDRRGGNVVVIQPVVIVISGRLPRPRMGTTLVIQPIAALPAKKQGSKNKKQQEPERPQPKPQSKVKAESRVPSAEAQAVKSLLALAHWNHDADDDTLLVKEGSQTLSHTDGKGKIVSRKLHLKRVVKRGTRELIQAFTDLDETLGDGSTHSVHWEKTLQEDGAYHVIFHHEFVAKDGTTTITDWQKAIAANGDITGTGVMTRTDAAGVVIASESLTLGGSTEQQQTIVPEPIAETPVAADPVATAPVAADPVATAPVVSDPAATAPVEPTPVADAVRHFVPDGP